MKRNVQEHITDIWELLGSDPQLSPFDDYPLNTTFNLALPGSQRILLALNLAQAAVAAWRDGMRGRVWRSDDEFRDFPIRGTILTGTVEIPASGDADNFVIDDPSFNVDLNSQAVSLDGTNWFVIVYSDTTVNPVVHYLSESVVGVGGADIEVRKNFIELPTTDDIAEVIKVADATGKNELTRASETDVQVTTVDTAGTPSSWTKRNGRIYFDTLVEDGKTFRVFVERMPEELVAVDDVSELPPQYDYALDLWAMGWGHGLLQDDVRRKMYRDDFTGVMRTTQTPMDMKWRKNDRAVRPKFS